ncbi:hypothetical protein V7056_19655 [Bacillus sp. JJ664]
MKQLFTTKLRYIVAFTLVVSISFNVFFLYKKHQQSEEEITTVNKLFDNYRETEYHLNALKYLPPFSDETKSDYQFHITQAFNLLTANENIIWIKSRMIPEYIKSFNNNETFDLYSIQVSINYSHPDVIKELDNYKKVLKNIREYVTGPSYQKLQEPQKILEKMNIILEKNNKKWH